MPGDRHGQQRPWKIGTESCCFKVRSFENYCRKKGNCKIAVTKRHTAAADMAEDVVRLLDHLKIEKAVILGFSDGANTALEFAADHPDRTFKIIAVSANALPGGLIAPMLFMERMRFCGRKPWRA